MWSCLNTKTGIKLETSSENVIARGYVRSFCATAGYPMSTPDFEWLKEMPFGDDLLVGPIVIVRLYEEHIDAEEHCKYCGAHKKIGYLCMECGRV